MLGWIMFKEALHKIKISSSYIVLEKIFVTLIYGYVIEFGSFINPRRMREGYGSRSFCLSVCLSVTTLAATYLLFKSQMKCHRVLHGVYNRCIVWILLKTLRSKVLA